jgi:Protein of unknown function (DUF3987)
MNQPPIATGGRAVNPAIAELAALDRWVVWKTEHRNGKSTKPPYCIGGRRKAKSTDPATWESFDLCWSSAFVDNAAHGVGYVLGDGVVGIDIDHCVRDGVIEPYALAIVRKINSYTEISPSGTGLHIICRSDMKGDGGKANGIEVYPHGRYFTITGAHVAGTLDALNHVSAEVLEGLLGGSRTAGSERSQTGNGKAPESFDELPEDLRARFNEACAWDDTLASRWAGEPPQGEDQTRSAWDLSLARLLRRYGGFDLADYVALCSVWEYGTGPDGDSRQRRRAWDKAGEDGDGPTRASAQTDEWPEPDLSVMSPHRLAAPVFPLEVFGPFWSAWLQEQAEAKGCPVDYVAAGLLASTGTLLGNARWGSPWEGWTEPPLIWAALVGLPASGKSPGLDVSLDIVRALERDANVDFEARMRECQTARMVADVARKQWAADVAKARKDGCAVPPLPPDAEEPAEPDLHRLITSDATIEKVARIVQRNPKGLLLARDELAGWLGSLEKYGGSGGDRAFYLEAFGARGYTVDRVKEKTPIIVPALTVGIAGGIQPDRLNSSVLSQDDDGMTARFLFFWPERAPIIMPTRKPGDAARHRLGLIQGLKEAFLPEGRRWAVPFSLAASQALHQFRCQTADLETEAHGFYRSWLGKMPGYTVRVATILEHLFWSGDRPEDVPPAAISERAVVASIVFLDNYAIPMARRCFGEAALPKHEKDAASVAKWLARQKPSPTIINARNVQRQRIVQGNRDDVNAALGELESAGWVRPAKPTSGWQRKPKVDWDVSPRLKEALP